VISSAELMSTQRFSNIANIIFDLDGTLIDSSEGVAEAVNYALVSLGEPSRSLEEIKRYIGYPLEEMFSVFSDISPAKLKSAFWEKASHSVVAATKPLPGVEELLPLFCQAGFSLAIATTKYSLHTVGIVNKLGWNSYFKALASGDEVVHVKPAPDLIQLALTRLKAKPKDSIMIGDTINDILSARSAGVRVIAVKSPFGNDNLADCNPDLLVDSFSDLRGYFL